MSNFNTKKKFLRFGIACLLGVFGGVHAQAQGAGKAIYFAGTSANEHINLGDSLSSKLDTASFTIEMWVNFDNATNGDPAIIGNKDWNSGANTGFVWAIKDASGTILRFNFRPASGTRRDYDMAVPKLQNKWNHIAIVVDRHGYLTGYINGVQRGTPINISSDSSRTLDGILPIRIGQDGTGTYGVKFNGKLDELRVWKSVRTQDQIRENMCHKLAGTETGLLAYYPMNEATGTTTITNNATAYASVFGGIFQNNPTRIQSSAPVGDTSITIYPASFAAQTLSLTSADHGNLTAQNVTGSTKGIHLYRIDAAPNTYGTIPNPNGNNVFYGVYPADTLTTPGTYALQYDYTNYPAANTFENGIDLFKRSNADSVWAIGNSTKNTTTNILGLTGLTGSQEMIVGNFMNPTVCNVPTSLTAQNVVATSATLGWISGGSYHENIQYGVGNFALGTGTRINNVSASSYNLTGLTENTTYNFYVQDTCTSLNGSSAWVGPYSFTTTRDLAAIGSGYAVTLNGTSSYANVPSFTDTIRRMTICAWIKPRVISSVNYAMILFGRSGSGTATGFNLREDGQLGYHWNDIAQSYSFNSGLYVKAGEWSYVTMVVDTGSATFYLNGVPSQPNVMTHPATAATNITWTIGKDGSSRYFDGQMDEVKMFKRALSTEEIRAMMCNKNQAADTTLMRYYKFNEIPGSSLTANDNSQYAKNATLVSVNATTGRTISGAPLGDTSVYKYVTNWNGQQLSLGSNAKGVVTTDSIPANVTGVQMYRINTTPNYDSGIVNMSTTNLYFGVFTAGDYSAAPRVKYDYTTYPNAVTNKAYLHLYNRRDNAVNMWSQVPAANNTTANNITEKLPLGTRQYLLADFVVPNCTSPLNPSVSNVDSSHATISWTSSSPRHVIEYGRKGFVQGTGTKVNNITTNTNTLSGLTAATTYEFFIKDSCGAGSNSAWVGPLSFTTLNPCPPPANVHADSITSSSVVLRWNDSGFVTNGYNISWGPAGLADPTLGIQEVTSANHLKLSGLPKHMCFTYYIRATCNSNMANSIWAGPYTFCTISCDQPKNATVQAITDITAQASWTTGGATHWNLEYGAAGFVHGAGILVNNLAATSYNFTGLTPNTNYEYYIQDSCSATDGSSVWTGPVPFRTLQPSGIEQVSANGNNQVSIYPNPANSTVTIQLIGQTKEMTTVHILSAEGKIVKQATLQAGNNMSVQADVSDLAQGIYILHIQTGNAKMTSRISVIK